jgi:hypothetical protein
MWFNEWPWLATIRGSRRRQPIQTSRRLIVSRGRPIHTARPSRLRSNMFDRRWLSRTTAYICQRLMAKLSTPSNAKIGSQWVASLLESSDVDWALGVLASKTKCSGKAIVVPWSVYLIEYHSCLHGPPSRYILDNWVLNLPFILAALKCIYSWSNRLLQTSV